MKQNNKINALNMGFAAAIISSVGMLLLSILSKIEIYTSANLQMEKWHMFYNLSFFGIITGMIEGGIIGFIFIYLLIKIYNILPIKN